jgi:hypothetical protein
MATDRRSEFQFGIAIRGSDIEVVDAPFERVVHRGIRRRLFQRGEGKAPKGQDGRPMTGPSEITLSK